MATTVAKVGGAAAVLCAGLCAWWWLGAEQAPVAMPAGGVDTVAAVEHDAGAQPAGGAATAASPGAEPPREAVVALQLLAAEDDAPIAGAAITWDGGATETTATGGATLPAGAKRIRYAHAAHGTGRLAVRDGAAPFFVPRMARVHVTVEPGAITVREVRAGRVADSPHEERRLYAALRDPKDIQQLLGQKGRVAPDTRERSALPGSGPAELLLTYGVWQLAGGDDAVGLEPALLRVDQPDVAVTVRAVAQADGSTTGVVVDQTGAPAVGVSLTSWGKTVRSGRDGTFAFPATVGEVRPALVLDVATDGVGFAPEFGVGPFAWGSTGNVVHVRRRGLSWLRAARRDGGALPVWAASWHRGENMLAHTEPIALVVQPDGRGLLPQAAAGRDWVRIEPAGEPAQVFQLADLPCADDALGDEVFTASLRTAAPRRVRVVDPDARPVVGASVYVVRAAGSRASTEALLGERWTSGWRPGWSGGGAVVEELQRTATDGDGVASFQADDAPQTFVRVAAPDGLLTTAVAVRDLGPTIVLRRAAYLWGEVRGVPATTDPFGSPVITLTRAGPEGAVDPLFHWHSSRVKDGRYGCGLVEAGRYELAIERRDHGDNQRWSLGTIDLAGSMRRDIDLAACTRVHTVITVKGLDLALSPHLTVGGLQNLMPDRAGRIEVDLAPGHYVVLARTRGSHGREVGVIADGEFECRDDTTNEWTAVFPTAGGTLRFVDAQGAPVRRHWFWVSSLPGLSTRCTDDDGCIAFPVFPGSRFTVQATSLRGGSWLPVGPRLAVEPAASTTVVVPDAALAPLR